MTKFSEKKILQTDPSNPNIQYLQKENDNTRNDSNNKDQVSEVLWEEIPYENLDSIFVRDQMVP